jgi:hypothetical protein
MSRKSWHFKKVSLDDHDISIEIETSRFCLDINVQTKKSRSRNSLRSENFEHFLTVCLNLDQEVRGFLYFLVEISQSVETFYHFQTQKALTMSRFLNKSWLRLDKSWRVLTISTKISMRQSLDWKVSILKILTEKKKSWHFKKVGLDTKDILNLDLDWSRLSRPPVLETRLRKISLFA